MTWVCCWLPRGGDDRAFAEFYRRWLRLVTAYHLRRTRSRELAFDLTAETFAAVVAGLQRFDPDRGSPAAWLFEIAEHKLLDSRRRARVESSARTRLGHEQQGMLGGLDSTMPGVVPPGVATVTLNFPSGGHGSDRLPPLSVTANVVNNVFVDLIPDFPTAARNWPSTMTWRSASGKVIKTINERPFHP